MKGKQAVPDSFRLCQDLIEKTSGFDVDFHMYGTWDNQFNGEIVITNNTDQDIYGWELNVQTNFKMMSAWAAESE